MDDSMRASRRRESRARALAPAAVAAAAAALLAQGAFAACGLGHCPRQERSDSRMLELGAMASRTGFDIQGISGGFTELLASAQYRASDRLAMGLHAPFILLEAGGGREAGMGNPIAYAEYLAPAAAPFALGAGAQIEIPMGGADRGLGGDHWMAAAYLRAAGGAGPWQLGGAMGTAFVLPGDGAASAGEAGHAGHPGHGAAPVYVHPHERYEFLYRVSAGFRLLQGALVPEAFLDGQRVLGDPESGGADFLSAGAAVPWRRGSFLVSPAASLPLLSDLRFRWSAGVAVGWTLGFGKSRAPAAGEA